MSTAMTSRLRRWAIVIGLVWLPVIVLWGPLPFSLTFDDAYYYFEIGRNLADGLGSTFDGSDPTNGYHPLWMAVVTLAYVVGFDDLAAVRALLVLQLAMWVAILWLLSGHVGRGGRPPAAGHAPRRRPCRPPVRRRRGDRVRPPGGEPVRPQAVRERPRVGRDRPGLHRAARAGRRHRRCHRHVDRPSVARPDRPRAGVGVRRPDRRGDRPGRARGVGADRRVAVARPSRAPADRLFGPPAIAVAGFLIWNLAAFGEPTQVSGDIKRLPLTAGRVVAVALAVAAAALIIVLASRPSGEPRLPRTREFLASTGWFGSAGVLLHRLLHRAPGRAVPLVLRAGRPLRHVAPAAPGRRLHRGRSARGPRPPTRPSHRPGGRHPAATADRGGRLADPLVRRPGDPVDPGGQPRGGRVDQRQPSRRRGARLVRRRGHRLLHRAAAHQPRRRRQQLRVPRGGRGRHDRRLPAVTRHHAPGQPRAERRRRRSRHAPAGLGPAGRRHRRAPHPGAALGVRVRRQHRRRPHHRRRRSRWPCSCTKSPPASPSLRPRRPRRTACRRRSTASSPAAPRRPARSGAACPPRAAR